MSSTDTRYFSTMGSPSAPQSPTLNMNGWHHNSSSPLALAPIATHRIERPLLSQQHQQQNYIPFPTMNSQPISIIEPTGCFVPIKSLNFIQKNEITKNHYVVPSFAMVTFKVIINIYLFIYNIHYLCRQVKVKQK